MSINGVSTIISLVTWTIRRLCNFVNTSSIYRLPSWSKMQMTIPLQSLKNGSQRSVNSFCGGWITYTAFNWVASFLHHVFYGQSIEYVPVYNVTNIPATSQRSAFFLQRSLQKPYHLLNMSDKGTSTSINCVPNIIHGLCNCTNP